MVETTQVQAKIVPSPLEGPWRIAISVIPKVSVTLVFLGIDSGLMGVGERLTRLAPARRDLDAMLVG
jgi:hypothetical protein